MIVNAKSDHMNLFQSDLIKIEGIVEANEIQHAEVLKIGNKNIQDLNSRWNNSLPIIYKAEKFKFEPSDYTDSSNYGVVDLLNKFVSWSISIGKERNFQIDTFLAGVENNYKLLKTDLHYIKLTNGINDEHRILIKSFITQYGFFHPQGFLVESEIAHIKSKLNDFCRKLQVEFLNESERYLDFEENSSEFNPELIKTEAVQEVQKVEKEELIKASWMISISKFFKTKEVNIQ